MAILSVTEEWRGLTGGADINSTTHNRQFVVKFDDTDTPVMRPLLALAGGQDPQGRRLPMGFEAHPFNRWLFVQRINYRFTAPMDIEFDIEYSNRPISSSIDAAAAIYMNPCEAPWDVEWFTSKYSDRVDFDVDGNKIANSVGELPDPNLQEEFSCLGLRIRRAQTDWSTGNNAYVGAVNTDNFWGVGPGLVLCSDISVRRMRAADFFYWDANFEFLFNPDGWKRRIRNESYNIKKMVSGVYKKFRAQVDPNNDGIESDDPKFNPTAEPVFIGFSGTRLVEGAPANWLEFKIKREMAFSGLNLSI